MATTKRKTSKIPKEPKQILNCSCCGSDKKETDFYMSKSFVNKERGRMGVCKSCQEQIYNKYFSIYQDEKLSIYYMCRALNICFNLSSFNAAIGESEESKRDTNPFKVYMTKLNSLGRNNGAGDDFDSSDSIDVKEEMEIIKIERGLDDEAIARWGNIPQSDMEWLEGNYNQWVTRHKCETRAEEILYEELVHMQLDIKKTRENGGDVVKKVEALQKLMASANIRPLDQNAMSVNENMMLWGTIVEAIEKNEPCEYFEEEKKKEYEDFKGYRGYFRNWIERPLRNLLASHKDYNIIPDEEIISDDKGDIDGN